jgi:CheY-like chemotaxis protein
MTELLQRTLGKSITMETRFPLALSSVGADANQLEIALLNLAVNARDAMSDDGEIVISARDEIVGPGETSLRPGRYVRLSVSDNGVGMDEVTLRRAVEPFFTTKQPGKGTGLGLSMVHGLAEQFGGRFVLRSKPGEGTTAELWLPADETARQAPDLAPQAEKDMPSQPRLAVLAVDDDPLVLTNTVAMLEDLGHVCFAATSADDALAILEAQDGIDLVVTDQIMPHSTGLQLARAMRKRWPDLPIMLATGYAEINPEQAMNLPRLAKPFTQAELAAEIAGLGLRSRKGAASRVINFRDFNGGQAENGA